MNNQFNPKSDIAFIQVIENAVKKLNWNPSETSFEELVSIMVKSDLELYIPKLKGNCVIAGHDYCDIKWPGVIQAVNEVLGKPTKVYQDTSWVYLKKELL